PQQVCEFLQRDFHLEDVLALFLAPGRLAAADGLALFALAHAHAAGVIAISERGQIDVVHRDRNVPLALTSDQFLAGEESAQVAADLPPDDLAETLVVLFNLADHRHPGSIRAAPPTCEISGTRRFRRPAALPAQTNPVPV